MGVGKGTLLLLEATQEQLFYLLYSLLFLILMGLLIILEVMREEVFSWVTMGFSYFI